MEREGADRPVPRGHSETIAVDGETVPVTVKRGVIRLVREVRTGQQA
ncbi:hypothetical protein ACFC0S_19470 [Streptomyces sp. NPDC056084]